MFTKPILVLILICCLANASSKNKDYDIITCNMIGNLPNMTITNENLDNGLYRHIMIREGINEDRHYINIDIRLFKLYKYLYQTFILNIKYYHQNIYSLCSFDGELILTKKYSTNLDDFYL